MSDYNLIADNAFTRVFQIRLVLVVMLNVFGVRKIHFNEGIKSKINNSHLTKHFVFKGNVLELKGNQFFWHLFQLRLVYLWLWETIWRVRNILSGINEVIGQ